MNLFYPELQLITPKTMTKYKFNELLSGLKKFRVQKILFLEYKKRNDREMFHSSNNLVASDSNINESLISLHQIIVAKIKNNDCEDWIVLDGIINHKINIFVC